MVNTQILINPLKPRDNTLFDAINGKPYEPEPIPGISPPETMLGMYAIINARLQGFGGRARGRT